MNNGTFTPPSSRTQNNNVRMNYNLIGAAPLNQKRGTNLIVDWLGHSIMNNGTLTPPSSSTQNNNVRMNDNLIDTAPLNQKRGTNLPVDWEWDSHFYDRNDTDYASYHPGCTVDTEIAESLTRYYLFWKYSNILTWETELLGEVIKVFYDIETISRDTPLFTTPNRAESLLPELDGKEPWLHGEQQKDYFKSLLFKKAFIRPMLVSFYDVRPIFIHHCMLALRKICDLPIRATGEVQAHITPMEDIAAFEYFYSKLEEYQQRSPDDAWLAQQFHVFDAYYKLKDGSLYRPQLSSEKDLNELKAYFKDNFQYYDGVIETITNAFYSKQAHTGAKRIADVRRPAEPDWDNDDDEYDNNNNKHDNDKLKNRIMFSEIASNQFANTSHRAECSSDNDSDDECGNNNDKNKKIKTKRSNGIG